jgi:hypothetical protein
MPHTPGPWIFYADLPSVDPNWHIVTTENKMRVLANVHIEPGNEMDAANAKLIASAPALLDACKTLASALRWHFVPMVENNIGKPAAHAKDADIERALQLLASLGVSRESV